MICVTMKALLDGGDRGGGGLGPQVENHCPGAYKINFVIPFIGKLRTSFRFPTCYHFPSYWNEGADKVRDGGPEDV